MKLYVIQNNDGKFFGNIWNCWLTDLINARRYFSLSAAKCQVTNLYKNHPECGCPKILVFDLDVNNAEVLDVSELTKKAVVRSKQNVIRRRIRDLKHSIEWRESQNNHNDGYLVELKNELNGLVNK